MRQIDSMMVKDGAREERNCVREIVRDKKGREIVRVFQQDAIPYH